MIRTSRFNHRYGLKSAITIHLLLLSSASGFLNLNYIARKQPTPILFAQMSSATDELPHVPNVLVVECGTIYWVHDIVLPLYKSPSL